MKAKTKSTKPTHPDPRPGSSNAAQDHGQRRSHESLNATPKTAGKEWQRAIAESGGSTVHGQFDGRTGKRKQ